MRFLIILLLCGYGTAQDLHRLAAEGQVEELRVAVRDGADVDARDAYGQTPLMYAIDHGRFDSFRALLSSGANVNARSEAGWTPLMYASRDHWSGAMYVEGLLREGADPRLRNAEGQTALDIAGDGARADLVALLEAAELLHEVAEPLSLKEVASTRTPEGYFVAAIVDRGDVILVERTATGPAVILRLREHDGVVRHLDDMGLDRSYAIVELALADPNEDGVPELLIRGGCECGAGPGFHVLLDGATGAALSVAQASLWDYPTARQPTHAYRFDDSAPGWMRLFLAGALAAHGFAPTSAPATIFVHEVRYTLP